MSTKVYEGYVFRRHNDFNFIDFLEKFKNLKDLIIESHKMNIIKDLIIDEIADSEAKCLADLDLKDYQIYSFYAKELSFVVFPKLGWSTYCMVFADSDDRDTIIKTFDLKEFAYYDNIDRPSNISNRKWKKRNDIWCDLLGGYSLTPNEAGLTFNINTSLLDITQDDFERFKGKLKSGEIDSEAIKKTLFKHQVINSSAENKLVDKISDYNNLNSQEVWIGEGLISLDFNFEFPAEADILTPNISKIEDFQFDNTLNEVVISMNDAFENRISELHFDFDERFKGYDLEDYIEDRNKNRDKYAFCELVFIDANNPYKKGIELLKKDKRHTRYSSQFNICKDLDFNRVIMDYLWDK